jgi:hypothetical protein
VDSRFAATKLPPSPSTRWRTRTTH